MLRDFWKKLPQLFYKKKDNPDEAMQSDSDKTKNVYVKRYNSDMKFEDTTGKSYKSENQVNSEKTDYSKVITATAKGMQKSRLSNILFTNDLFLDWYNVNLLNETKGSLNGSFNTSADRLKAKKIKCDLGHLHEYFRSKHYSDINPETLPERYAVSLSKDAAPYGLLMHYLIFDGTKESIDFLKRKKFKFNISEVSIFNSEVVEALSSIDVAMPNLPKTRSTYDNMQTLQKNMNMRFNLMYILNSFQELSLLESVSEKEIKVFYEKINFTTKIDTNEIPLMYNQIKSNYQTLDKVLKFTP